MVRAADVPVMTVRIHDTE
ncbi:hypothetical protein [Halomarina oriensis]